MGLFVKIWGILTILPIVAFLFIFIILFYFKKDKRYALQWSINITNIFLIHSVTVAYSVIWPEAWSAWWLIVLLFAGIAFTLGWLQKTIKGELSYRKIGLATWRITFLLLGVTYIFLFSTGVWKTMQESMGHVYDIIM